MIRQRNSVCNFVPKTYKYSTDFVLGRFCLIVSFLMFSSLALAQEEYFFFSCNINEQQKGVLLFDTGFSHSILQKDFTKDLNLHTKLVQYKVKEKSPLIFYTLKIPFWKTFYFGYSVNSLLQSSSIPNQKVTFYLYKKNTDEFGDLEKELGDIDGILGWSFIQKHNWSMDFIQRELSPVIEYDTLKTLRDNAILKLDLFNIENRPFVKLKINSREVLVLFDTGSNRFLSIGENIFNEKEVDKTSRTFYGVNQEKYVHLDSVKINNFIMGNVNVGTASKLLTHKKIMGLAFMSLFDKVVIDNSNQQILFLKEE